MMTIRLPALLLVLLASTASAQVSETIFDALIPRACVNTAMLKAGACTLQKGCANRCFDRKTTDSKQVQPTSAPTFAPGTNVTVTGFSLNSVGLSNFYIPVDAVECSQFEDPICPATTCCPVCKNELNELYKCIILEGDHHYIDPLAKYCPLDCKSGVGGTGSGLLPTSAPLPTNAPVPAFVPVPDDEGVDIRFDSDENVTDFEIYSNETDDFDFNETDIDIEAFLDAEEELNEAEIIQISDIAMGTGM